MTRVNYQPNAGVNVQLAPDLVGDLRDVIQFRLLSMLRKSLRSERQMTVNVGQVNCREKLDGIGIWICGRSFELLKDRCIIFPVRQENIVKQRCQLVDLTWNRHIAWCRLPFRILALPHRFQRCCPHCHTIGGDLATMGSTRYLHHVLRECCNDDASNWRGGWPRTSC